MGILGTAMVIILILAIIGLLAATFASGYSLAIQHSNNYQITNPLELDTDTPIDAQVRRDLGIE